MTRGELAARIRGAIRADHIHPDRYAAIGLATLHREPIAFLPMGERAAIVGVPGCEATIAHTAPALTLAEAAAALASGAPPMCAAGCEVRS